MCARTSFRGPRAREGEFHMTLSRLLRSSYQRLALISPDIDSFLHWLSTSSTPDDIDQYVTFFFDSVAHIECTIKGIAPYRLSSCFFFFIKYTLLYLYASEKMIHSCAPSNSSLALFLAFRWHAFTIVNRLVRRSVSDNDRLSLVSYSTGIQQVFNFCCDVLSTVFPRP